MNAIFLDIDGVLNSESWYERSSRGDLHAELSEEERRSHAADLDPNAVSLLNTLSDCGCSVVLSSSWRLDGRCWEWLVARGLRLPYGGSTPYGWAGSPRMRGEEIDDWLKAHAADVGNYAIFDDDSDMLESQMGRLVLVNSVTGLTAGDVGRARRILEGSCGDI